MTGFKPYREQTDQELAALAGVQGGAHIESMRRLRVAVERLNAAGTALTVTVIVLMLVQIALAVWAARGQQRYQIQISQPSGLMASYALKIDTVTGRTWYRGIRTNGRWEPMETAPEAAPTTGQP